MKNLFNVKILLLKQQLDLINNLSYNVTIF